MAIEAKWAERPTEISRIVDGATALTNRPCLIHCEALFSLTRLLATESVDRQIDLVARGQGSNSKQTYHEYI